AVPLAQPSRALGGALQLVIRGVLVAQLEDVDAAAQRRLERLQPVDGADVVQARVVQPHGRECPKGDYHGPPREPRVQRLRGRRLGLRAQRLLPSAARALEPALAPSIRLAAEFPDDHSADPRALADALVAACERAGVVLCPGTEVTSLEAIDASQVVLAAGPW